MTFEDRLRESLSAASETLPGRPLDWGETYGRARRRRRIYVAAVAFGTALVVAVAGFGTRALLEGRDGGPAPVLPAETATPRPTSSPSESPTEDVQEGEVSFEGSFKAVTDFLAAAAEGDARAMWDLMTDPSKAVYNNDFGTFRNSEQSGIAEGWGSWAVAEDVTKHWQVIASSGDGTMGVVTIMGSRAPEGRPEPNAAAAIPVRMDRQGNAKVELFVSEGVIEYVTPRDRRMEQEPALDTLSRGRATFEADVPGAPDEVFMVAAPVPDEPALSLYGPAETTSGGGDGVRAVWSPEERLFSGEWFLTVVAIYDGAMQADSLRFMVE